MSTDTVTAQERLVARLKTISPLEQTEIAAILAMPVRIRELQRGQEIVREGDRTTECCVLIEGFLQRHKDLPSGKRQILAFHIPGDMPDLQSLHLPVMDHTLSAVMPSTVAMVQHVVIQGLIDAHTGIAQALWREALIDAAKFREWIANLGGRPALPRLAHLLCEMFVRSSIIGLGQAQDCPMPLTQAQLGEALGLSIVHVNRMLKQLRDRQLAEMQAGRLRVLNWPQLQETAEFDAAYLHLKADVIQMALGA